uniref:Protein yls7-like n=1 Tax=Tetraselmis sp. GSL018 TaxID=582737 RepID=A0A061SJ10_9CHLO
MTAHLVLNFGAFWFLNAAVVYAAEDVSRQCDIYNGNWTPLRRESGVYHYDNSCPFIDQRQACIGKDTSFLEWEWQPNDCNLPLFDPWWFLDLLRNRSIAFIGDSLGRNQFESLSCLLAAAEQPQQTGANDDLVVTRRYPAHNVTTVLILSPFLVEHTPHTYSTHMGHKTVHLDIPDPDWHFQHRSFDVVYFASSGRWFLGSPKYAMKYTYSRYRQPSAGKVEVAFLPDANTPWYAMSRAFRTVKRSLKSQAVVLWKTYSPSHYTGGAWDSGGHCHRNRYPNNLTAAGVDLDPNVEPLEEVFGSLINERSLVTKLNVTHMAMPRNDAHPGDLNNIARKSSSAQDCVHWCLPGIPDVWNRFLLVEIGRRLREPA